VSDAEGHVTFAYHSNGVVGTDSIRANIATLLSNTVTKTWIIPTIKCDADSDGDVDMADLLIIRAANGTAC